MGKRKRAKGGMKGALPYPTMPLEAIKAMPVPDLADVGCHLWLWTTNAFLRDGFDVMAAWGFKYLAPIHWIKPTGCGNYVIHRTQTVLLGYKERCRFEHKRYFPNILAPGNDPTRHSAKPKEFYELIEAVSKPSRLELFARNKRENWDVWGNEVISDIRIWRRK
jgi:N6-adenosine-specific RNA methylase IME4